MRYFQFLFYKNRLKCILPKSHVAPEYPAAQTHTNWFTWSTHVAPFVHGLDEHSLISENHNRAICYT
jgi:hypothetical protein